MQQPDGVGSVKTDAGRHTATGKPISAAYSYYALTILTLLNLLNYVDRFIFAALVPYIKEDLHFTDAEIGTFSSAFTIVYTILSPVFGYLADRRGRVGIIAFGIGIWSLATALGGVARNFWQMFLARAAVGVGEASYATISPGFLSDYFDRRRRGFAFGVFFAAVPMGQALGFILGGKLAAPDMLGWRHTFFVVGVPGLLMALIAYFMREPERGKMDEEGGAHTHGSFTSSEGSLLAGYKSLFNNRTYLIATLAYAAIAFALGILSFWAPTLLVEDKGLLKDVANVKLGIYVTLGGLLGTLAGGWLGDLLLRWTKGGYFLVCGVSSILSAVPLLVILGTQRQEIYFPAMFVCVVLLFLGNGPVNAIIVNSVAPGLRATAVATTILLIHFLGDALSVPLVGWLSTRLEEHQQIPAIIAPITNTLGLTADKHLSVAMLITPIALLVGGILFLSGMGIKTTETQSKEE